MHLITTEEINFFLADSLVWAIFLNLPLASGEK